MTLTTLVFGASASAREAAIWSAIESDSGNDSGRHSSTALILEGLADGKLGADQAYPNLEIKRIAPGCFCCIGNLTLRVTLNRLLRNSPARLYISIADDTHRQQIRQFLSQPPYDDFLAMTADIAV
ncbi:GTPase [Paraherbaspirillum soli]|uniref:GTPase n=1 Tax=Paraherbaspirillum soli TaxID=631222 RepID=A0ABW0M7I4_9BURK